jgi:hypothetical protein
MALSLPREIARVFPYRPSHIATVSYPWRLEQSHAMLIGTTGMGKTVAISDMIAEARAKGQRCVVFDLTGAFIEHFHAAHCDIILNRSMRVAPSGACLTNAVLKVSSGPPRTPSSPMTGAEKPSSG